MFPCDKPQWNHCLAVYQRQLLNITQRLVATGSKLQYALTTPVRRLHGAADRCADWSDHAAAQFMPLRTGNHTNVEDMNAAARKIMSAHRIPIVDLCEGPSLPVPCNRARSRAPPHLHLAVQTAR